MIIIETCPKCGHDLRDEMICTYPPIPRKVCCNCGWSWTGEPEKITRVPFSSSFPDKKCNKKAPERGQRIKCNPIDDAFTNKMCQSESDHEWKITELSSVGASYMCRKCGAKKIVLWEEN